MVHSKRSIVVAAGAALLIASLACAVGGGNTGPDLESAVNATLTALAPTPGADAAQPAEEATDQPTPEPTAIDPVTACPQAGADQAAFTSLDGGFCFVYPAIFKASQQPMPASSVALAGPPDDPNSMEPLVVFVTVSYNGPAHDVATSAAYGDKWASLYVTPDMQSFVTRSDTTFGGQPAVQFSNMPGMISGQTALVVANGHKYQIEMFPQIGAFDQVDEQARGVWDMITGSMVFFTPRTIPTVTVPGDVCPQAAADTQLYVGEAEGFCFLAPVDAEKSDLFPSGFEMGPVLAHPDFPDLRTRIVVSTFGPANGATTPREAAPGFFDSGNVDVASIRELTIGGAPAADYVTTAGPFRQRGTMIVANDTIYTISLNPYDQGMYPEAFGLADLLWNTVTNSLQFFSKWK